MRLTLDEFRKEHQRIMDGDFQKERLENFIYQSIDTFPEFYSELRMERIWYVGNQAQIVALYKNNDISATKNLFKFDGHIYGKSKRIREEYFVDTHSCIGDSWLFCNDFSNIKVTSLAEALFCSKDSIDKIPALNAYKAGDKYICTDGNHRIYAAYLLGRPVKISYYMEYLELTI